MVRTQYKICIFFMLWAVSFLSEAQAQPAHSAPGDRMPAEVVTVQGDSVVRTDTPLFACTSVSTGKIMTLHCPWSESQNAASLLCLDCRDRVASAWMGFRHTSGDYRRFQEPEESSRYGFFTNGWSAVGPWRFYGNFSYYNENSPGTRWASIMEPYSGNPYTVGDSVGGDYSREYFLMEGKAVLPLTAALAFGFDVKYKAGVGTKRKDPRPENTITDFEISPAFIWSASRWKVGANFRYVTGKEDIGFSSVTGNKFDLFYFRGLGSFSTTMEDDDRYTQTELFGGGLQANYGGSLFSNLTSVSVSRQTTGIKRGSTYQLQVVLLDNYSTEASTLFLFLPEEKDIRRLKLWFSRSKIYGEEPVVEPKLEEISWQWATAAKYTLYWHEASRWGAQYAFFRVIDNHHINWGATLAGEYAPEKSTYYFVPEFNRQKISLLNLEASLEKGFLSRKNQLVVSLLGGYHTAPSKNLEIVEEKELRQMVHMEFLQHDFDWATADWWEAGVTADYGRECRVGSISFQFFVEGGFQRVSSDFRGSAARNLFHVNAGINF